MNTPTPRTDAAWAASFAPEKPGFNLRDTSEMLERELAALATERDQLRAENNTLRAAQKACEACDEPTAFEVRQLRAEAERTDAIYQRACEVEHELRAELVTEREKAERYRLVTLRQDGELDAERARLDWVFRNCKVEADDYTTGNRDVYAIYDREDLGAAMKEDAK
jgi:chromosome segregation ATPase